MQSLAVREKNEGNGMEKIYIPVALMPTTGYGEIKLVIQDGKIVDCKTTTSHKIIYDLKNKKE